jgi:fructose-bisphosphate aldolase class II
LAELGTIAGSEDGIVTEVIYADPQECFTLVSETQVDASPPRSVLRTGL